MDAHALSGPPGPVSADLPFQHLLAFWRAFQRVPGTDSARADGLLRWRSALPDPFFNGVLAERPARADESAVIQNLLADFRGQGLPAMSWWLPAGDAFAGWPAQLRAQGFTLEEDTPGMLLDLAQLAQPDSPLPQNVRLVTLTQAAETQPFVETLASGFDLPAAAYPLLAQVFDAFGKEWPWHNYLAYVDDQPAAVASLFLALDAAGIYTVATRPEFRGRGLGTALTLAALRDARALGYRTGVLQASPMGLPIYQKIGFQTTCTITHYTHNLP